MKTAAVVTTVAVDDFRNLPQPSRREEAACTNHVLCCDGRDRLYLIPRARV